MDVGTAPDSSRLLSQPERTLEDDSLPWRGNERVLVNVTMLENAGRYPLEQPRLDQLVAAAYDFCIEVTRNQQG